MFFPLWFLLFNIGVEMYTYLGALAIGHDRPVVSAAGPWDSETVAVVHWDAEPSGASLTGFEDTANALGVRFERTHELQKANLRIWTTRKRHAYCKLGTVLGFAEPAVDFSGITSGDIHICPNAWFARLVILPTPSDHSLMAHETAHLLAGVGHFGDGLMAALSGARTGWFSPGEIEHMRGLIHDDE